MLQRGRKSAAGALALRIDSGPPLLEPPSKLTKQEAEIFTNIVTTCRPTHFVPSDLVLLVAYAQATAISQNSAHDPSKIVTFEKSTRVMALLATKLRLAPQSRVDSKVPGRSSRYHSIAKKLLEENEAEAA